MDAFLEEKSVLQQLEKARDTIRRKHSLLKQSKADFEKSIGETFKPIVDPLEKLIAQTDNRGIKRKKVSFPIQEKEEEYNDETLNSTLLDESLKDPNDTIRKAAETSFETADSDDEENPEMESIYLKLLNKKLKRDLDLIYGVRKSGQHYMIGDATIQFEKQAVKVNNKSFRKTDGLLELLFKKDPSKKLISQSDSQNYRDILEITNAHKKQHDVSEEIRRSNSRKFRDIISPMFNSTPKKNQKTGTGFLPSYKVAKIGSLTDYVYWDDPNELVDRLRLLMAESQAGNPSHINEIHSIIEELREGGYIY